MSRHLSAARQLLLAGCLFVLALSVLAVLGVDAEAISIVAGVCTATLTAGGAVSGVSAGRHLGEGLQRPPSTTTPGEPR